MSAFWYWVLGVWCWIIQRLTFEVSKTSLGFRPVRDKIDRAMRVTWPRPRRTKRALYGARCRGSPFKLSIWHPVSEMNRKRSLWTFGAYEFRFLHLVWFLCLAVKVVFSFCCFHSPIFEIQIFALANQLFPLSRFDPRIWILGRRRFYRALGVK